MKKIKQTVLILALVLTSSTIARAMPGQTFTFFKNWASKIPIQSSFSTIKNPCSDAFGGALSKTFKLKGQTNDLLVVFDCTTKVVDFESLTIYNNKIVPATNNESFISYIKTIYGSALAQDFAESKDIYTTKTKIYDGDTKWASALKGKRNLYIVDFSISSKDLSFNIFPLKETTRIIKSLKDGSYYDPD